MSPPERSFRLFDVGKCREIRPAVEAIHNRTASNEQAITLINKALSIVETDEFQKNNVNSPDIPRMFQETITLIEYSGVSSLPERWYGYDVLAMIICVICCPNFQELGYSDFHVDYTESYGYVDYCNDGLSVALEHTIGIPSNTHNIRIYDSEQLAKITQIVSGIDPKIIVDLPYPRDRAEVMKFYTDFIQLVKITNSLSQHTIFYET
jgi:hypothetical protein